jgi:polyhydroxyalkanoate synthesis regulator phasin
MSNGEGEFKSGTDQARDGIKEGVRAITGFLAALKDAIDETIRDVRDSGDLDPDRAKQAMKSTMKKAADAVDNMTDRIDFVARKDLDQLRQELDALRARVTDLETKVGGGPGTIPVDGA